MRLWELAEKVNSMEILLFFCLRQIEDFLIEDHDI